MKPFNAQAIASAFADAAIDPSRWTNAMNAVARETGSVGAMIFPVVGTTPNIPASESLRESIESYLRDGWHLRDERFRVAPIMAKHGVADDFDFTTPEEMKRHPYFQEFLRPFGLQYFGAVKMAAGDDLWALSIQRSLQQGPFTVSQKRELADLSRQISSAAAVARALGFAAANATSEAFELSGSAVALLNRHGEVLRLNRTAEALFDSELRIVERRIVPRDRRAKQMLDRALHSLLGTGASSALLAPVVLPRQERRPILAYPLKLSTISTNIFSDCQAVLVLVDLEKRVRPPEGVLRSAFGLTAAEARLASRIASGAALETIADELQISKETARNELKAVFQKTDAHRQAELVTLLASFLTHPTAAS